MNTHDCRTRRQGAKNDQGTGTRTHDPRMLTNCANAITRQAHIIVTQRLGLCSLLAT
jgi:hypothetical protein